MFRSMINTIKISVIIPVYKVPLDYLRYCLSSLSKQTMRDCEFIVVSDGAPDAENSVCEEYVVKDSRFKFFKREHAGVSASRNYGLDQASGEFIAFLDSDDWFSECALQLFYDLIKNNQAEIGIANVQKVWNNDKRNALFNFYEHVEKISLKNIPNYAVWGYIFKKDIIVNNQIRFQEDLNISEDRVFLFDYFTHCKKIAFANDVIYFYRQHEASICNTRQTHEHAIQQLKAAKYLYEILKNSLEYSQRDIRHLERVLTRMGMVAYINSGITKEGFCILREFFLNNICSSTFIFYYCWYRSRISALIGNILHL